ncbi:MAG: lytic transglycosylase domain-containing protein [Candidatus Competibacteraceae bacterium]
MTDLIPLAADRCARQHGLPIALVRAVIEVESDGNPCAVRYEPGFFDRYVRDLKISPIYPCSLQTERMARATSWGLMQIMGQKAREMGFAEPYLSRLCEPDFGLEYGCRFLAALAKLHRDRHGWEGVAAGYNAGSPRKNPDGTWANQPYVDKIRKAGGFE